MSNLWSKVFEEMFKTGKSVREAINYLDYYYWEDNDKYKIAVKECVERIIKKYPNLVDEYKHGNIKVLNSLIGKFSKEYEFSDMELIRDFMVDKLK